MKRPRDISSREIVKRLKPLGYRVTRQVGSHMRLTTEERGQHHITIPNHKPGFPQAKFALRIERYRARFIRR